MADNAGLETDRRLQDAAFRAIYVMKAMGAPQTVQGNHAGGNTCAEVISNNAFPGKARHNHAAASDRVAAACSALQSGLGWKRASADHGGGNTCVEVLAQAALTFS